MKKRAFFHNGATDNRKKDGSFYDVQDQLHIQWVLKEAYGEDQKALDDYEYNNWWKWDNAKNKNANGKKKHVDNRNAQRFTRYISYCLMESYNNQKNILNDPNYSNLKGANNAEKGYDYGPFKSALKKTSVMNIIEDPTLYSSTRDERLKEAWRTTKQDVIDTIKYACPDVLIFCIRPEFFENALTILYKEGTTILNDLKKEFGSIEFYKRGAKKTIWRRGKIIEREDTKYFKDSQNNRLIISMHHPSQGFDYDTANEIINVFCDWKGFREEIINTSPKP